MSMNGAGRCDLCGAFSDYCEVSWGAGHEARIDCRELVRILSPVQRAELLKEYKMQRSIAEDAL